MAKNHSTEPTTSSLESVRQCFWDSGKMDGRVNVLTIFLSVVKRLLGGDGIGKGIFKLETTPFDDVGVLIGISVKRPRDSPSAWTGLCGCQFVCPCESPVNPTVGRVKPCT
jgi:hypothetical protein